MKPADKAAEFTHSERAETPSESSTKSVSPTYHRHCQYVDLTKQALSALECIAQTSLEGIRGLPNPYQDPSAGICAFKEIGVRAVHGIKDIGLACCHGKDQEESGLILAEQNPKMEEGTEHESVGREVGLGYLD